MKDQYLADTHDARVDLLLLHKLLGHYARLYLDLQKSRIGMGNRIDAMERDGIPDEHMGGAQGPVDEIGKAERAIKRELERLAKQHPMAPWVESVHGFGFVTFALLMGVTGPLDRFPTVSKLWKYLGMAVIDGHAPRRERGMPWTHTDCQFLHLPTCKPGCKTNHHQHCVPGGFGNAYSPVGRTICHEYIGENGIVKQRCSPYRPLYDQKKAEYEAGRSDWSQARRHNAAVRYAVKALLRDLWVEWNHPLIAPTALT